jgi:hypothetical protein
MQTNKNQKSEERDYKSQPNRFQLQMLYNDKLIANFDRNGQEYIAQRDFDSRFYEPEGLGANPLTEIQNSKNKPHIYENVFENSWEAVSMGDKMIEVFRLALRQGTEEYLSRSSTSIYATNLQSQKSSGNKFTLVIYDNHSLKRDEEGLLPRVDILKNKLAKLQEMNVFGKITPQERDELHSLSKQLKDMYVKRELFRCSFSADDYSYNGKDFTPPLNQIWKDFNVYFKSPKPLVQKENVTYADIEDYQSIMGTIASLKREKAVVFEKYTEALEGQDNIKTKSLEKALAAADKKITNYENTTFKGLRTIIKEAFGADDYTNRFLTVSPKVNTFTANSAEIVGSCLTM